MKVPILSSATVLLLACSAPAAHAEAPTTAVVAGGDVYMLEQHEVPYALRAQSLLSSFARLAAESEAGEPTGRSRVNAALETHGLDPASPAARHLLEVARKYREQHPQRRPEVGPDGQPVPRKVDLPLESYAAAGEAFGRWLQAREAEGWAIDPLVDRLLNSPYFATGYGSSEGREQAARSAAALAQAFHRGLRGELGYLPRNFQR